MRDRANKIGSFMVAVGAVIIHAPTGKVFMAKRDKTDQAKGYWDLMYGRIDQHEDLEQALRREVVEETGITDLKIKKVLRIWHIYRGKKSADTEIFGVTFICETNQKKVTLSDEHSEYKWVEPKQGLKFRTLPGIKQDLELYIKNQSQLGINISDINNTLIKY